MNMYNGKFNMLEDEKIKNKFHNLDSDKEIEHNKIKAQIKKKYSF